MIDNKKWIYNPRIIREKGNNPIVFYDELGYMCLNESSLYGYAGFCGKTS